MRSNLLYVFLLILIVSCSKKEDEEVPVNLISEDDTITTILHDAGVYPESIENIQYLSFIADSSTYKLAGGQKDSTAWISKFDQSGKEIFSYKLNDIEVNAKYSYIVSASILKIENDLMFVSSYATNFLNPTSPGEKDFMDYYSILSVVDFNTGKEITKLSANSKKNRYVITKENVGYVIEETANDKHIFISTLSLDGGLLWNRAYGDYEKNISQYPNFAFLNSERIIYDSEINEDVGWTTYVYPTYKVINLKEYKLIFQVLKRDIPYEGDFSDIIYERDSIYEANNSIYIHYNEFQKIKIIDDQISGAYHFEYNLLDKYFCELNSQTGAVINYGKL